MKETLAKAWQLFDSGKTEAAEKLYLDCYEQVNKDDYEAYTSVLMGLIYVESFMEKYDEARKYAEIFVGIANNEEERHVALHQYGMVERMAENYSSAKQLFKQEAALIHTTLSNDDMMLAANFYEQAYIELKIGNIDLAEEIMTLSIEHAISANDSICTGCAYRGMGEILKARGDITCAKQWFHKAMEAFSDAGDLIAVEEVKELAEM